VPPYPETQGYVRRIMATLETDRHPFDDGITEASPMLSALASRRSAR